MKPSNFNRAVAATLGSGPTIGAGGDASGPLTDLTIVAIQRVPVCDTPPAIGEALIYDGSQYCPAPPGASITGMVPYYIEPGTTFTVPLYKQALFAEPIEVDGALVVLGVLVGVD